MKKSYALIIGLALCGVSFANDNSLPHRTLYGCLETQALCFFNDNTFLSAPMGFQGDFFQSGDYLIKQYSINESELILTRKPLIEPFKLFTRTDNHLSTKEFAMSFNHGKADQQDYYDNVEFYIDDNANMPLQSITLDSTYNHVFKFSQMPTKIVLTKYEQKTNQPLYRQTFYLSKFTNDIVIKSEEFDKQLFQSITYKLIEKNTQAYLQDKDGSLIKILSAKQLGKNRKYLEAFQQAESQANFDNSYLFKNEANNIDILPDAKERDNYVLDNKNALYIHKNAKQHRQKFTDKTQDDSVLKFYEISTKTSTYVYPISK